MTREEAIRTLNFGTWRDNLNLEMSDADSEPLFEALDMAISALKQQQDQESKPLNGWISVKDKLPEDQVEVLVLTRSMKGMRNVDKGYWSIDHFIHRGCAQVTHWMPMPELPEREKTEE